MPRKTIAILILIITIIILGLVAYMLWLKHERPVSTEPIIELVRGKPKTIDIYSPAFNNGTRIPRKYTCDGEDISIPLKIENIPSNTRSLLLIMYDPDAPRGTFYHWIMYNIPANISELPENIPKDPVTKYGLQGRNDYGKIGYGGPCPPPGSSHRYYIVVIALDTELDLSGGASLDEVIAGAKDHVLAYGVYMGIYGR